MGRWNALTDRLVTVGETSLRLTWTELNELVGGLPPSASRYRAWWSEDRPHVRAWRAAGFELGELSLGREALFVRRSAYRRDEVPTANSPKQLIEDEAASMAAPPATDLLLVTCVKTKLAAPARARDLYVSPLFKKQRRYAESLGVPWFILSAEHGLVAPDEWLAPYEPDTPEENRKARGAWVVERLELR